MSAADESPDPALEATGVSDTLASDAPGTRGGRELPQVTSGRYAIAGEIGRGGLGRVMRARDEVLDRPVALKELFAEDDGARRRFTREALITARLQHPSIVPVYDAGRREDRSPFYAMKLVAGRPLDRAIADAKTLADRLALLPSVLAVADAIAYAHSERVIHRDLKPANVLVGQYGETIVIDWGLAKDLSIDDRDALPAGPYRGDTADRTVEGTLLGTPGYMAPEQAAGEEVDERADVYALGAILYHLVSGMAPHQGTTIEEVIARLLEGDIRPLVEREPETPRDLAAIVAKAMAMEPAKRYRTAGELAEDLRRFQTGQLVGAHHYTFRQRLVRTIKRNRALSAVLAIALVVLAIFVWRIIAERGAAIEGRTQALETANEAVLSNARAMRDRDPAITLVWLSKLAPEAKSGWDEARLLAAEALAHPRVAAVMRGPAHVEVTLDGRRGVGFDQNGYWILDLVAGTSRLIEEPGDPNWRRRVELCDDGKHAFVHASGDFERTFELDLATGAVTKHKVNFKWVDAVERCKTTRGVRATEHGLTFRGTTISTDAMESAWLTPDGKRIVALDRGGSLRRFDLGGKELGKIAGPPLAITKRELRTGWPTNTPISMSRDGSVAVIVFAGRGTFWSFTTGTSHEIRKTASDPEVLGSAVMPDGSSAIATSRTNGVVIRNVPEPEEEDHQGLAGVLAMDPDGTWLAVLQGGNVSIMEVAAQATRPLLGHRDVKQAVFLSKTRLLTAGDGTVRVWELAATARKHEHGDSHTTAVSPDGRWIALDLGPKLVRRDPEGTKIETVEKPDVKNADHHVAIDNTGHVVASNQGNVVRWPPGGAIKSLGQHAGAHSAAVAILPDGTPISASERSVALWLPAGPRYIELPREPSARYSSQQIIVDDSGKRALVTCVTEREIQRACLVDLVAGRVEILKGSRGEKAMSGNGRVAITGSDREEYLVWDLDHPTTPTSVKDVGTLRSVGLSRNGTRAAVGGSGGVNLVALGSTEKPKSLRGARAKGHMTFSPDGRTVIDSDLALWDVASGRSRRTHAYSRTHRLLDHELIVVAGNAIVVVPDDLPRDPIALQTLLRALPYRLDEHEALEVAKSNH